METTEPIVFDVWDGTVGTFPQLDEDGWYVINTCGELAAVAQYVNNGKAPKGMNYKYRLAANLDLNNHTWTPIGGGAIGGTTTFTNTFDGAGHIIKNMKITNALYGGLFGVIENINDMGAVRISGITVHGTIGVSIMAGGIAALSAMHSIENCINYCTVVGSQQVGGIVGGIISAPLVSTGFTSIRNCINFGNIIIGGLTDRSVGAGGILGGMLESAAGLQFQIYSCTNYGDIEIQPPLNNIAGVGGIVGTTNNTKENIMLKNCVMLGNMTIDKGVDTLELGGIIGRFNGNNIGNNIIENCTFNGDEISVTDGDPYIGGICGKIQGNGGVIRYCSAYTIQPAPAARRGGIVGFTPQPNLVMHCYYSDGNDNSMGGTMVSDVNQFPITSCILRQYKYEPQPSWMKGTNYPRNVGLASGDITLRIRNASGTTIRTVNLPVRTSTIQPEYILVDLSDGAEGSAIAPKSNYPDHTTIIFSILQGG